MKNPERLAASKKKPMVPIYLQGHIVYVREGTEINKEREEPAPVASVASEASEASEASQEPEEPEGSVEST